jgi:mannosylglucosylglycerate synthase
LKRKPRICFLSGKLFGTDGVSLETSKWIYIAEQLGYEVFSISGQHGHNDTDSNRHLIEKDLGFKTEFQIRTEKRIFPNLIKGFSGPVSLTHSETKDIILELESKGDSVYQKILSILRSNSIDLVIGENTNCMPMSFVASMLVYYLRDNLPVIGHHHDFYQERERFSDNNLEFFLRKIMPPRDKMSHVIISRHAMEDMHHQRRLESKIIPNVFDFEKELSSDDYIEDVWEQLGVIGFDYVFVQPTRVVRRKGIEYSIETVNRLGSQKYGLRDKVALVVSLNSEDEPDSQEYKAELTRLAERKDIPLFFVSNRVNSERRYDEQGRKCFTHMDLLRKADFVTYPSIQEGFGNAFLEATHTKKPILIGPYTVYNQDIASKGFDNVVLDYNDWGKCFCLTDSNLDKIYHLLTHPEDRVSMVERNYEIARQHFGYNVLIKRLGTLLKESQP